MAFLWAVQYGQVSFSHSGIVIVRNRPFAVRCPIALLERLNLSHSSSSSSPLTLVHRESTTMSEQQSLAPDQAVFSSTDQDVQRLACTSCCCGCIPRGRRWSVAKTAATLIHIWSASRLPAATAVRRSARRSSVVGKNLSDCWHRLLPLTAVTRSTHDRHVRCWRWSLVGSAGRYHLVQIHLQRLVRKWRPILAIGPGGVLPEPSQPNSRP